MLSRKAKVLFNDHPIRWPLIVKAWCNWNRHLSSCCAECILQLATDDLKIMHHFSGRVLDFVRARDSFIQGQSILKPLLKFRSRDVSVPQDKIYGLLGLQTGPGAVKVRVDSVSDAKTVYRDFAIGLIKSKAWVVPLHLDLSHCLQELSSWVPDWSYKNGDPGDYDVAQFDAASSFDCSQGLKGKVRIQHRKILELPGIEVDYIVRMSQPYRIEETAAEQLNLIDSWLKFVDSEQRGGEEYPLGGTLEDAANRTLLFDRFHSGASCRQLQNSDIQAWITHVEDMRKRLGNSNRQTIIGLTDVMKSHVIASLRRRLCFTAKGYIGLCPERCRVGDRIFVLCLCKTPIFLRPLDLSGSNADDKYVALGHGYVHGMMDGMAVKLGLPVKQVMIV